MTQRTLKAIPLLLLTLMLALVLVAVVNTAMPTLISAATAGPLDAGTGANNSAVGATAWGTPTGIQTVGAPNATMSVPAGATTYYLEGTDYGFTIPDGATIDGITVTINRQSSGGPPRIQDSIVELVKAGTVVGANLANLGANWPAGLTTATYGGTSSLWGTTWTPADINATNFGVVLSAVNGNGGLARTATVDYIEITVTYHATPTTLTVGTATGTYGGTSGLTATLTVTAGGAAVPGKTINFTLNGSPAGTSITDGSGIANIPNASLAGINAATYGTGVGATFAGDAGYGASSNTNSLTVDPKAASVTPNANTKVYGDADPALNGTLTGFLPGDNVTATYSRLAGETVLAGPYTISATLSPAGLLGNYDIAYNTGSFTIIAKVVTVGPADNSKVYGDPDPALSGTLTGFLAGDNVTATYIRVAGETVLAGPYTISATLSPAGVLSNYDITYNTGSFTITPVTLTVTGITADSKTYDGDTIAQLNFGSAALAGAILGDSVTLDSSSAVGTFADRNVGMGKTVTVTGLILTGIDAGNYTLTPPTATANVTAFAIEVTADDQSKTYGDADSALTYQITSGSLVGGDNFTGAIARQVGENVGTYNIEQDTLALSSNYNLTFIEGTLTISPKPLTITANDRGKTYGQTVTFAGTEFAVVGLLNADTVTGVTLTSAGVGAAGAAGTHAIVPSAAMGTGLSNYDITYVNGTLTVNPKDLSITADSRSKTYGTMITFARTEFTTDGLVNGDTVTSMTLTSAGAGVDATVDGSPYAIVPNAAVGAGLGNYNIIYVNGSMTVNKVSFGLSLSSSVTTSTEGNTITFTATVTGTGVTGTVTFKDGETTLGSSVLSDGTATYTISTLPIGSHSITAVYSGDDNFAGSTSSAIDLAIDLPIERAARFNWWALVGALIATDVLLVLLLLLLILRRRRKHPSNTNIVSRGTQVTVGAAGKNRSNADSDLPNPASSGPLAGGEVLTAGTALSAVENVGTYSIQLERELEGSLQKVQKTMEAAIQAISHTVEVKDPYVATHQKRVSQIACAIAKEMGLTAWQIDGIRVAGMLHDIGKITVPTEILSKPGELSPAEISLIKDHPKVAFDILKNIDFDWPIARIVVQHHERMDGSGYPYGIPGKDILIEARILAVADVVEAMCTDRPYRPALGIEEALAELALGYGTLYDSEVVAACKKVFNERGFKIELSSSPS